MKYLLVYITVSNDDEAKLIASTLLEERLIACANIIPQVKSMYRWQGKIEEDQELLMLCKSKEELKDELTERVKELHSYDCPCISFINLEDAQPDFLKWLSDELK